MEKTKWMVFLSVLLVNAATGLALDEYQRDSQINTLSSRLDTLQSKVDQMDNKIRSNDMKLERISSDTDRSRHVLRPVDDRVEDLESKVSTLMPLEERVRWLENRAGKGDVVKKKAGP